MRKSWAFLWKWLPTFCHRSRSRHKKSVFELRPRSLAQYFVSAFYNTVVWGTALRARTVNYGFMVCRSVRKSVKPAKNELKNWEYIPFLEQINQKKSEIMAFLLKITD